MGKIRRYSNPFYKKKYSEEQPEGPRVHLTCDRCARLHVIYELKDDYKCVCGAMLVELDPWDKMELARREGIDPDQIM